VTVIYPLDFIIVIWGVVGTYRIKRVIQLRAKQKYSNTPLLVTTLVFILVPLIALRANVAEYSAFGIIAASVEVFWFAFLASRSSNAT